MNNKFKNSNFNKRKPRWQKEEDSADEGSSGLEEECDIGDLEELLKELLCELRKLNGRLPPLASTMAP